MALAGPPGQKQESPVVFENRRLGEGAPSSRPPARSAVGVTHTEMRHSLHLYWKLLIRPNQFLSSSSIFPK